MKMLRTHKDAATGIPVWSLYAGQNRRPNDEMLRDIDVLVFDIQDVGARFYTYTVHDVERDAGSRQAQYRIRCSGSSQSDQTAYKWKGRFWTRR